MKHYITTVSLNQTKNMDAVKFQNGTGNPVAEHSIDLELKNGIMVVISNTAEKDEKIMLTLMVNYKEPKEGKEFIAQTFVDSNGKEYEYSVSADVQGNYNEFIKELDVLKERIGFEYDINYLFVPDDEKATTHFDVFSELIHKFDEHIEDTKVYVDITFGMAPMPVIIFMVLNYLYKFNKHIRPDAIIYVHRDHETKIKTLFELSHMFSINEALENMSKLNIKSPIDMIENLVRGDINANE